RAILGRRAPPGPEQQLRLRATVLGEDAGAAGIDVADLTADVAVLDHPGERLRRAGQQDPQEGNQEEDEGACHGVDAMRPWPGTRLPRPGPVSRSRPCSWG